MPSCFRTLPTKRSMMLLLTLITLASSVKAFSARLTPFSRPLEPRSAVGLSMASRTAEAPTREDVDTNDLYYDDNDDDDDYSDLEYNIDLAVSRELEDPYHILLLGTTFETPKMTVSYVASSLEYVLNMPSLEAKDICQFARDQGLACLGTWTRKECLQLGRQLQVRDLKCRVVPYTVGGQRGWQAKNANDNEVNQVPSE